MNSLWSRFLEKRLTKKVLPHTLVSRERIHNLYVLAQRIERERIPGDVIECGVYKGGTAAVLARVATHSKMGRTVWLFDSFQGMPQTTEIDGDEARQFVGKLVASPDEVRLLLRRVGADLRRVKIIPGLFQDTFSSISIEKVALLNLDCDWYDSVKLCLDRFYGVVADRGFISLDDYGHWHGCRLAVDAFFKEHDLSYILHEVDYSARFFQKLGKK